MYIIFIVVLHGEHAPSHEKRQLICLVFIKRINWIDESMKFTTGDTKENMLIFLECAVVTKEEGSLNNEV